jgi:phosphoglucomutase
MDSVHVSRLGIREGIQLLAGEGIQAVLTRVPGNGATIGGLTVVIKTEWFTARLSGPENIYKIDAESFHAPEHLRPSIENAQPIVRETFSPTPKPERATVEPSLPIPVAARTDTEEDA